MKITISQNKNIKCRLSDVLYVPSFAYNLLSVSKATSNGKAFHFEGENCYMNDIKHGIIDTTTKYGNFYHLNCTEAKANQSHAPMNCDKRDQTKEDIWHRRFGHLDGQNLKHLAKENLVQGFDYDATKILTFCEPCIKGKQSKLPFPKAGGKDHMIYL